MNPCIRRPWCCGVQSVKESFYVNFRDKLHISPIDATLHRHEICTCVFLHMQELMEGGMDVDTGDTGGMGALSRLSSKLSQFLSELKTVRSRQFLLSLAQLCYSDTQLAYEIWVSLFPRLWTCLSDHQRQVLSVLQLH